MLLGGVLLCGIVRAEGGGSLRRLGTAELADLSLEELMEVRIEKVVGASRYDQKVTRAPASVSIVSAKEIAALGHRTLADVLRGMRGLYVTDDSDYMYLGVRGFLRPADYNTRVLMLVDGHRMNENVYDGASIGHGSMPDLEMIERVEFIRGPSSSIYGSSAFFGVINVVTNSAAELGGAAISYEGGTENSRRGSFRAGHRWRNNVELTLAGSYYQSDGRDRIYYPEFDERISDYWGARNQGVAEDSDQEDAATFHARAKFHGFTLTGFVARRSKRVPTASFESAFNTQLQRTDEWRGYVDLQFDHRFQSGATLQARGYFDRYRYTGDYPYEYGEGDEPAELLLNRDEAFGDWVGTEWQATIPVAERHTLVVGAEFRQNLKQDQFNFDLADPADYLLDEKHRSRIAAVYAQGEIQLTRQLLLNAGVRYDDYMGSFGSTTNPRLGLIYTVSPATTVKALHGKAFRAPNSYERFYYNREFSWMLQPERIETSELVVEHYFASVYRASVSIFNYSVSGLISQIEDGEGGFYFRNRDATDARGVEFEIEAKYESGLRSVLSYARQRTEDVESRLELSGSPRHLARFNLICPFGGGGTTAGFELEYQGAVQTIAQERVSSFLLGNFHLRSERLFRRTEVSLSVHNIFDKRYASPGAVDHVQMNLPQAGRSWRLKITRTF